MLRYARLRDAKLHIALLSLLRSEEHTSELQSQSNLVCRLLLEKKKKLYLLTLCETRNDSLLNLAPSSAPPHQRAGSFTVPRTQPSIVPMSWSATSLTT